nr:membrane protein, putative [Babesia bovis]
MSEEMNDTPIETLQSYPSELFMEQVLKIGSSIAVQPETGSPSVGDLTVEGNMELPVVDLETPINLPSLFLMLENKNVSYFAYDGSFTYPGCEETVRWYVAKDPLPISTELMLQINRMLNQKRTSESANNNVNKYRELQNVDPNIHHIGKVYMVHGYPMEYFIATSLQRPPILPLPRPSGFFTPYWGLCIALVVVVFTQL